ncbi:MAG: copper chaperone PCu(A)C [Rhodanobacteraceae bacterium]
MNRLTRASVVVLALCVFAPLQAHAAGKLSVHDATIELGGNGAESASGYATLGNTGDSPLRILSVQSDAFRAISLLQAVDERGVTRSREMIELTIAPGETVSLQAQGMRLMLMDPRHAIAPGEEVHIVFLLGDGARVPANFDVVTAASEQP